MGQIHTSGQIPKAGLNVELEWVVVGNGLLDISENEFELWYGPQDRFTVQVRPPGMDWLEEIEPGQFIENRQLPDGSFISIYNELYHSANGANTISIYLSPQLSQPAVIGVHAGTWLVRIRGKEVRDGQLPRLDRARRSAADRSAGSQERVALPLVLLGQDQCRRVVGELARLRRADRVRRQPRRDREDSSTSAAARARRATGAQSPTSPRQVPTSSPPRDSRARTISGCR